MMTTVLTSNSNTILTAMAAKHQQVTNNDIVKDQNVSNSRNDLN